MLDLKDDNHPSKRGTAHRPLTPLEKEQAIVIVLTFVVWLPIYLIWARPAINDLLFQYIDSYPASLHLVPIIGLPTATAVLYQKLSEAWGRH